MPKEPIDKRTGQRWSKLPAAVFRATHASKNRLAYSLAAAATIRSEPSIGSECIPLTEAVAFARLRRS